MLISPEYRALNRELHENRPDYGTSGHKWANIVQQVVADEACVSALDYGCGKQTLSQALGNPRWLKGYDPAVEGLGEHPDPADMVICGDVLEHVEPDCIDAVLDDIERVMLKMGLFVVATRPAVKTLGDGRNAHLIVKPPRWWLERILKRFDLVNFSDMGGEFVAVVRRREGAATSLEAVA